MRVDVSIPRGWEELSSEQLLFVVKLFKENLSRPQFLVYCFLEFSGWQVVKDRSKEFHYKYKGEVFSLNMGVFKGLCEELSWLITERGACTNLPKIGIARGCDAELDDVTLEQYLFADAYFHRFNQTKDPKYLAILTATLYRPRFFGFNSSKIVRHRYKYFLRRPLHLKVVLLWYAGTKIILKEKFPFVFRAIEGVSATHFDAEAIYRNTLSALNGGRVVDNDKILQVPCTFALKELDVLNERAAKLKNK